MIWLICGGRAFADQEMFDRVMREIVAEYGLPGKVVHGKARGADAMADEWGARFFLDVAAVPADWTDLSHKDADIRTHPKTGEKYDAKAGPRRNQKMLDEHKPNLVIAFPGKFGTTDMIFRSLKAGIRTIKVDEAGTMVTIDFPVRMSNYHQD